MKKVLIGLLVLIAAFVGVGFILSPDYEVERSVTIQAAPAQVHALVEDLKRWPEWMPWWEMDETIETTYGAKTRGVGATQAWTGEDGAADIEITESKESDGISYIMRMDMFGKKVPSYGHVVYSPSDSGLRVTWKMDGKMEVPVLGGYFALGSDRMIGDAFQQGLDKLKAAAEAQG